MNRLAVGGCVYERIDQLIASTTAGAGVRAEAGAGEGEEIQMLVADPQGRAEAIKRCQAIVKRAQQR